MPTSGLGAQLPLGGEGMCFCIAGLADCPQRGRSSPDTIPPSRDQGWLSAEPHMLFQDWLLPGGRPAGLRAPIPLL